MRKRARTHNRDKSTLPLLRTRARVRNKLAHFARTSAHKMRTDGARNVGGRPAVTRQNATEIVNCQLFVYMCVSQKRHQSLYREQ